MSSKFSIMNQSIEIFTRVDFAMKVFTLVNKVFTAINLSVRVSLRAEIVYLTVLGERNIHVHTFIYIWRLEKFMYIFHSCFLHRKHLPSFIFKKIKQNKKWKIKYTYSVWFDNQICLLISNDIARNEACQVWSCWTGVHYVHHMY